MRNDRQTPTNNETDPESTDQPEIEPLEPVPTEEEFQKTSPDEVFSEPNVEPTSKTICSSLNPEAEPFISPTAVQSESTPTGTKGEESDDERDSNETPIETGLYCLKYSIVKAMTQMYLFRFVRSTTFATKRRCNCRYEFDSTITLRSLMDTYRNYPY